MTSLNKILGYLKSKRHEKYKLEHTYSTVRDVGETLKFYGKILIRSFDMVENLKHTLSAKRSDSLIAFLAGMRFLSMIWVVYGHTYFMQNILTVG